MTPLQKQASEDAKRRAESGVPLTLEEEREFVAALNHLCESKGIQIVLGCGCCNGRVLVRHNGSTYTLRREELNIHGEKLDNSIEGGP